MTTSRWEKEMRADGKGRGREWKKKEKDENREKRETKEREGIWREAWQLSHKILDLPLDGDL